MKPSSWDFDIFSVVAESSLKTFIISFSMKPLNLRLLGLICWWLKALTLHFDFAIGNSQGPAYCVLMLTSPQEIHRYMLIMTIILRLHVDFRCWT
jgi:hypothetical protein